MEGWGIVGIAMSMAPVLLVVAAVLADLRRKAGEYARRWDESHPDAVLANPEAEWVAARDGFAAVQAEFAGHECDVVAVLRLPALSDVSVPSTGRFVEARHDLARLDRDGVIHVPRPAVAALEDVGRGQLTA